MAIDVVFRWEDVGDRAEDKAVLVIDTLRATTTMVGLFEKGADRVMACPTVEEAFAHRISLPSAILGGERQNQAPPGFDAGNSIFDYPETLVHGRSVVFTTTNGTRAIDAVTRTASWVGLACLRNRSVAGAAQQRLSDTALIVCAGTAGATSWEDTLTAGAIVDTWPRDAWTDGARLAWTSFHVHRERLLKGLMMSRHAQILQETGMGRDIEHAAALDATSIIPVRDAQGWFVKS